MGMLVLTRMPGQRIVISGGITIEVCRLLSCDRVRIGIDAPKGISILREELVTEDESGKRKGESG